MAEALIIGIGCRRNPIAEVARAYGYESLKEEQLLATEEFMFVECSTHATLANNSGMYLVLFTPALSTCVCKVSHLCRLEPIQSETGSLKLLSYIVHRKSTRPTYLLTTT